MINVESKKSAGVYVRKIYFPKIGDILNGHVHYYDHVTVVLSGAVRITVAGEEPVEARAINMVEVKAGKVHTLTALEDDTIVACVHMAAPDERVAFKPPQAGQ